MAWFLQNTASAGILCLAASAVAENVRVAPT
jgi:hypothetical protein